MAKPIKIVVHNDLDGGGSAICIVNYINQKYGKGHPYDIWFGGYDKVNQYVERVMDWPDKYEEVIIADISTNVELAKDFPSNFLTLDHHDSAAKLNGIGNCIIDTSGNHCGASLCYKHLLMDNNYEFKHLTNLVKICIDYDLYHLKLPKNIAKNLNFLYYYYWGEKFIARFLNGFDKFTDTEKIFLKSKWADIEKQIADAEIIDLLQEEPGKKGKFGIFIIKSGQDAINDICENAINVLGYDIIIAANPNKGKISVRASTHAEEKGMHVGMLHESLGIGGGHPKAGGAQYGSDDELEKITEAYANRILELEI